MIREESASVNYHRSLCDGFPETTKSLKIISGAFLRGLQMRINRLLLFIFVICGFVLSGYTLVNAQSWQEQGPSLSWQAIVEHDRKIWNRRLYDRNIFQSITANYNRLKANVAEINQIAQNILAKLRNKDCISYAMAINSLEMDLQNYPYNQQVLQGAIKHIRQKSMARQCSQ
jgi:hypothetical protein